ncbi:exodeoxyribonuclease V subunit gamma [Chitinibacter tainanensis]|uniref:exodeoxyribonuclease V subunit gamma n=1 Tax=Chitinibacter tainanensis TaxID=230667 RepID=UPI002354824E|nr:exodeoxyribonuclease V subunit gamma [Chitinibacter tainanensis]
MTARLNLFQSNRLENLFELMLALIEVPLTDPLANEKIIVSSKGMERWLRFALARRTGICAGVDFALPAGFVWQLLQQALPGLPKNSPYGSAALAWRLFEILPRSAARAQSPIVAAYLQEGDERRRMALAGKLADVFDQYLVFRRDWIAEWEAGRLVGNLGPDEAWQAALWREAHQAIQQGTLAQAGLGAPVPHRAEMFVQLFARWAHEAPQHLPERLTVFGLASMPPAYIDVLGALAEHIDVNLFLLNPCREDWGAIVSPQAQARQQLARPQESLYLDVGHPLLASMGKAGRDFYRAVTEAFPWTMGGDGPLFLDPAADLASPSLLQQLQSDILNLRQRGDAPGAVSRYVVPAQDRSLSFHSCHSPMREVEVMHDQICHWLAADPTLLAADIAVLLPDLGPYAPLIEAVFGGAAAACAPALPFNIADLTTAQECPAIAVFLQLFNLPASRCTADEVFGLLENPQLAARFGISADELATLQHWISSAGIRWGLDAAHRAEVLAAAPGLAELGAANTWQAGLDSLILGAALPQAQAGEALPLWQGLAPWDDLEGSQVVLLAKLQAVISALASWRQRLQPARTLAEWSTEALQLLEAFFLFDPHQDAERLLLQAIRSTLAALAEEAALAELNTSVSRLVVLDWLTHRFDTSSRGSGFVSRGVTFCTMVPMRGLPFRRIAVLGLNESDFPRNPPQAGFDLIAQNPRLGDRSRRLDDRYLFLEILLAARDGLYLSWVGRGVRDNEAYPPSVLVADVLDVVRQGFAASSDDDGSTLLAQIYTEYPLQVFSPQSFQPDTPVQSFNPLWGDAARRLLQGPSELATGTGDAAVAPVLAGADEIPPLPTLTLGLLAECLSKPATFFLRYRAQLNLDEAAGALPEDEPFDLRDFADRLVRERTLQYGPAAAELLAAQGQVPLGTPGRLLLAREIEAADALRQALPSYRGEADEQVLSEWLALSHAGQSYPLAVTLDRLYPAGQLIERSKVFPREVLRFWLRHLAYCALGGTAPTRVLAPEEVWCFAPLSAVAALSELNTVLAFVLAHWQRPQAWFSKTALQWQTAEPEQRWDVLSKSWYDSFDKLGEYADPAIQLLWPEDPLAEESPWRDEFADWSERLLAPLFAHLSRSSLRADLARQAATPEAL